MHPPLSTRWVDFANDNVSWWIPITGFCPTVEGSAQAGAVSGNVFWAGSGAVEGAMDSLAFGVGALPGAMVGSGIGLQVGNLILMALGLAAIAEYFYQGLPACLATLQEGLAAAWHVEDGLKPAGLDPSGGSAAQLQERTERAARQLARGQEQLVVLLTAIVPYLTRGQMKAGVMNSMGEHRYA